MSASTRIGSTVAGYRLETLLGHGGMSVVYVAEHVRLGRKVALKLLAPVLSEDESFRERFVRESRRAAELEHPNIVPIYDAGEADGQLYIAMRYVEGSDLKGLIRREGQLNLGRTLWILEQVASALDAAHDRDLVHRDVKPANILIAEPSEHVYLTDFGVVKHTASRGLTRTGFFVGTVDYAAPEQIEGMPLDARTDVYALGAVLYECLTGKAPFEREGEVAVLHAHLTEPPPKLTSLRPDLPRSLDNVIASAMAKSKEERPDSCEELIANARAAGLQKATTTPPAAAAAAAPAAAVPAPAEPPAPLAEDAAVPAQAPAVSPDGPAAETAEPALAEEAAAAGVSQTRALAGAGAPPTAAPPEAGGTQPPDVPPTRIGRGGRGRMWALAGGAAALAAIAAVVVVLLVTRDGSETSAPTLPATTAATTQAEATNPPATTATEPPATTDGGAATAPATEATLASTTWPEVSEGCVPDNPALEGTVESSTCVPPTGTLGFPEQFDLLNYPSTAALNRAYEQLLDDAQKKVPELSAGRGRCDGAFWTGEGDWFHAKGDPDRAGRRFCYFDPDTGNIVVVWTHVKTKESSQVIQDNHIDLLGIAFAPSSSLDTLSRWWRLWHTRLGKVPGT